MSIEFPGALEYMSMAVGNLISASGDFSLCVWFNTVGVAIHNVISNNLGGGGQPGRWGLTAFNSNVSAANFFYNTVADGNKNLLASSTTNDGVWHLIVVTRTGNTCSLYVDTGVAEASDALTGNLDTTQNYNIGRAPSGTDFMDGEIHDLRIYDRALSQADIETLYHQRGADNIVNGLVLRTMLWYAPDGTNVIGTFQDFSVNSNGISANEQEPSFMFHRAAPFRLHKRSVG